MAQVNKRETSDEVIAEGRRIKAELAQSMNFEISRILEDARESQRNSGRPVLSPPVRQGA